MITQNQTGQYQTLTPSQEEVVKDLHRFRVLKAGRRFGKTVLSCIEIVGKAYAKDCNIIYVATTYQQARDIAWNTLKKICDPIALNVNESRLEIKTRNQLGGTSLITLRGWENIETLRGQRIDFAVLDEVAMMRNFWENWSEIIRPTLTDTKGEALFISTPKGYNHFYDLYNVELKGYPGGDGKPDPDFKSFHFTTYDNPFIPLEEIAKAKLELTDDRFAQEYLGDWRKTEGLVYKEFKRDIHTFDDTAKTDEITDVLGGIDFGFINPCAILTIKKDYSGHYWVWDEWYKSLQTDAQIAEIVVIKRFSKVYPDPESPSAIAELRKRGVNVREVVKNKDSIYLGIQKIRELLKAQKLHVHKSCVNTIMEFETYCYPDKTDLQNFKELPIKENDHAMDALRYAIYMQPLESAQRAQVYIPSNLKRAHIYIPRNLKR